MANMSYDWQAIEAAVGALNAVLAEFREKIATMYTEIANMEEAWSGESYQAFKTYCETYRTGTIEPMAETIQGWVNKLETLSSQAKSTQSGNVGLFGA